MTLENVTTNLTNVVDRLESALANRLKELESTVAALKSERDELAAAAQSPAAAPVIDTAPLLEAQALRDAAVAELEQARTRWSEEKNILDTQHAAAASESGRLSNQLAEISSVNQKLIAEKAEMTSTLNDALQTVDTILASLKGKVNL